MNKLSLIFFIVLFVFSTSHAADLIQENEKGEFSAQLNNIKLSELTTFIQKKYNIEFKGEDNQLQTSITLSFEKLNFEQMLKKILTRINFVFTYSELGKITKVTLLQTGNNKADTASKQNTVKNNAPEMPVELSNNPPQGGNPASDAISNFPGTPNTGPDEITSYKIVRNAQPPGGAVGNGKTQGPDPITSFKIVPNAPPPGN